MKDGFYALAIAPQDREAFTINVGGYLLQFVPYTTHGMFTSPVNLPKNYGGIYKIFKRPGEIKKLFGRATLTAYQDKEEIV